MERPEAPRRPQGKIPHNQCRNKRPPHQELPDLRRVILSLPLCTTAAQTIAFGCRLRQYLDLRA
jgi:hypothetical protein